MMAMNSSASRSARSAAGVILLILIAFIMKTITTSCISITLSATFVSSRRQSGSCALSGSRLTQLDAVPRELAIVF